VVQPVLKVCLSKMDDCNVPLGLKDIKNFFDLGSCSSAEPACLVERLPTKPHAGEVFLVANSTDSKGEISQVV